jgi:hypothetical protein
MRKVKMADKKEETYTALCALSWQDIKQLSLITQTVKAVKYWMPEDYHVSSYSYFYCGNTIRTNCMIHIQRNCFPFSHKYTLYYQMLKELNFTTVY